MGRTSPSTEPLKEKKPKKGKAKASRIARLYRSARGQQTHKTAIDSRVRKDKNAPLGTLMTNFRAELDNTDPTEMYTKAIREIRQEARQKGSPLKGQESKAQDRIRSLFSLFTSASKGKEIPVDENGEIKLKQLYALAEVKTDPEKKILRALAQGFKDAGYTHFQFTKGLGSKTEATKNSAEQKFDRFLTRSDLNPASDPKRGAQTQIDLVRDANEVFNAIENAKDGKVRIPKLKGLVSKDDMKELIRDAKILLRDKDKLNSPDQRKQWSQNFVMAWNPKVTLGDGEQQFKATKIDPETQTVVPSDSKTGNELKNDLDPNISDQVRNEFENQAADAIYQFLDQIVKPNKKPSEPNQSTLTDPNSELINAAENLLSDSNEATQNAFLTAFLSSWTPKDPEIASIERIANRSLLSSNQRHFTGNAVKVDGGIKTESPLESNVPPVQKQAIVSQTVHTEGVASQMAKLLPRQKILSSEKMKARRELYVREFELKIAVNELKKTAMKLTSE